MSKHDRVAGVALLFACIAFASLSVGLASAQQPFRSGVELVSLPVTVEDADGRLVTGLTRQDFTVHEDGVEQEITAFSDEPQPISLAVLVDFSGSMRGERRDAALAAVRSIGRALAPADQWSLFAFADRTARATGWGPFAARDLAPLGALASGGGTRLYAAVLEAHDVLRTAPHRKRALLVISDGNDISTQIGSDSPTSLDALPPTDGSEPKAMNALRHGETLLYAFGMDRPYQPQPGRQRGPSERVDRRALQRLAGPTGGRVWMSRTREDLQNAARQLTEELRQQYTLGYSQTKAPDGKYRRIRVTTRRDEYRVRSRGGYLAVKR